ncbi:hypothetical protein ACNKHK_12270 [Shigella flexneri]
MAEHAPLQNDPHELTAVVRVALGRAITQQWFPGKEEVQVIGLDTRSSVCCWKRCRGAARAGARTPPAGPTQEGLSGRKCWRAAGLAGESRVRPLRRRLRRSIPQLVVSSNMELSDNRHIRMTATIWR